MKIIAFLLAMLAGIAPALAEGPCERSGRSVSIGGLDLDHTRCQLALDAQAMGEKDLMVNSLKAGLALSTADLAKTAIDAKALADYWASYVRGLGTSKP